MLMYLRKPSRSRAVTSTRAAATRTEMISGQRLEEDLSSAFLRLAARKNGCSARPWISPRAAFCTGSLAEVVAALWSTRNDAATVRIVKTSRINPSGGPLPPPSCGTGLVAGAPTSDCGGGCSLIRPNTIPASHGVAVPRKPCEGGSRATDRPAGRDELGVVRRLLPARQRDGARAARRAVVRRLPAALGRLRPRRGDAE